MIASLHKKPMPVKGQVRAFAFSLCALIIAAPIWAQDTTDQSSESAEQTEAETAAEQVSAEPVAKNVRRERYYLGERPQLRRQQGPALGTPKSIVPQPFVPRGSVAVPPAPLVDQAQFDENAEDGALPNTVVDAETAQPLDNELTAADADTTVQLDAPGEEQFLEAGALELLDPSGIGLLPEGESYTPDFWAAYDRREVVQGYAAFAGASGSNALASIAKKIALSGVTLPEPADDADVLAIIQARLSLLADLGDREGYIVLLERLPAERDWSALVKDFTNKHLLKGELSDACAVAAAERVNDDDPYWLRLAAFCQAAQGNRVGVDFQLGILEEVAEIQPTFYQLIDQILVEASQAPGTIVPEAAALSNSLQVDLLEATMARLARAKVPLLALDGVNPLAVRMMLSLPGVERAAKIDLMGLAVRRGWLHAETIKAFAVNHELQDGEMEAALDALDGDRRFIIDAALVHLSSNAGEGTNRADALAKLWQRSVDQRTASNSAGGYLGVAEDIVPNPEAGPISAILARAALIAGDSVKAHEWFTALRAESAGTAELDSDLIGLAPLLTVMGGNGAPAMTEHQISLWWQVQAEREDRFERANLLFTVLEALGTPVSEASWKLLEGGPAGFSGSTPSAALWRGYLMAVQNRDVPKALARSFALMAERGPAGVSGALAGSLVGGLQELGLEDEARRIAIEILVGQGL
ncbi:MAG: hypothetical protein AB3N28_13595 [Kordiimonas sp.]